jgi:hypothetical protein
VIWKRPEHRAVAACLTGFDAELLADCGFRFAGGTRIVLEFGEYRLSRDIDFICSDASGYAKLRALARRDGAQALFRKGALPGTASDVRADQYGIRFALRGLGASGDLRIEFVREGRIDLQPPVRPDWSPVPCLSIEDCFTEKLLANSDRWADRHVCSRDLVDLAVLRATVEPIPESAWWRAQKAYGPGVRDDLRKALDQCRDLPGFLEGCLGRLDVSEPDVVHRGLALLRADPGSPPPTA